MRRALVLCLLAALFPGVADVMEARQAAAPAPTAADAKKFADDAEQHLLRLWVDQSRADWVKSTFITDDTETLAAQFADRAISAAVSYAKQAAKFDGVSADPETARKLRLLKLSLTLAAPADPAASAEVTRIATARSITPDAVRAAIARHTTQPLLGFLGQPAVNVLLVNLDLDGLLKG